MPGWITSKKIVVFESDDWGSIRMTSKDAYKAFLSSGLPVDKSVYNKYDAIESNKDLELLYDVLDSVKDRNGNPAIITINNIVANPDFDKIKDNDYRQYYYETFIKTLRRYPERDKVYELYKQGMHAKVIKPQYHGREHLNVNRWMNALRSKDKIVLDVFEWGMFSVNTGTNISCKDVFLDAYGISDNIDKFKLKEIIEDGLKIFKDIIGYSSYSAMAPCYIWDDFVEDVLHSNGVKIIQSGIIQYKPRNENKNTYEKIYHYQGQRNRNGQIYLTRNCYFEPCFNDGMDHVGQCMKRIETAFRLLKPAIISSHRVNFMGYLYPENRERSLRLLKRLLKEIVKKWPDVIFISSDMLGKIIIK